ncbi:Uncharacterised protein [Vibrio cholerae]|nr:Uncharacterised protein [Vibrio cholerae]
MPCSGRCGGVSPRPTILAAFSKAISGRFCRRKNSQPPITISSAIIMLLRNSGAKSSSCSSESGIRSNWPGRESIFIHRM